MSADAFRRFTMHNFQCQFDSLTHSNVVVMFCHLLGDANANYNKTGIVLCHVTLRHVCANIVAVQEQGVLHILSVFVALGIQRALCKRHIVICLPG
jgi:hypothetical protein